MRDAAALVDGPRAGEWYWSDDWRTRRDAATAMGYTPTDPPGWSLGYQPARGRLVDNPKVRGLLGAPWVWRP